MPELGPEAQALLSLDATHGGPTREDAERVRRGVLAQVTAAAAVSAAAGAAGRAAATGAGGAAAAPLAGSVGLKVVATLVLGVTIGVGSTTAYFRAEDRAAETRVAVLAAPAKPTATAPVPTPSVHIVEIPEPTVIPSPPVPIPAPRPSSVATSVRAAPAAVVHVPVVPASATAVPPPSEPSTPTTTAAEVTLLRDAKLALRSGDAGGAAAILEGHARRFPAGALAAERDALRVQALCALHREADAHALAQEFAREHGDSPLGTAVARVCGL